jgi:pilus assembly protein CpaE
MKDAIRVLLIDPLDESRQALQQLLSGIGSVWLAEVCPVYQGTAKRVGEVSPNLVIVSIDHDAEQAIALIQAITEAHPGLVVLPASKHRDSAIILRVIRAGAREFLTLPADASEVLDAINRLFNRQDAQEKAAGGRGPQVIAVTGAAGGVGCTTLAVNLGTTLAKTCGSEVVLADFDLMLGSVDACLDVITNQTLQGIVQNIDRLDLTLLKRSLAQHASNLYVLPHPIAMEDAAKIDPELLRRVLTLLKAAFPTVLIDTSKGLQSSDFVAFEAADQILIVVQLDLTCLRNTSRLLHLFQQFDGLTDRIKLVANRVGSHDAEISLKKAEETLRMPISWQIPNATKLFHAARAKGVPIDAVGAGSRVHQSVLAIAKTLHPNPTVPEAKPKKGLFAAFF